MDESALFMRLCALMKLSGADKELRKVFDALMFHIYVAIFICLLKALLLLFELLSRIFVTVASWRGRIQADAEAKAEVDANVDKLKPSCCMNRAKRSKKAKRPHLNDKNASPTTLSNSCEAHPGTTASMHELNVAARPSIFEIAPMHTNNTRPQSLSAASNQPARSLDEISGLAGSRNINTDGVSAAIINKLDKATLSVEHLYMDAAQAPSSARRVPATLALATAAETSASIPPIDDEINTPLDDDLAESHIGGEVGVTEVAVDNVLEIGNAGMIQAISLPVSVPCSVPALNVSTALENTIGADNLLVADGTGVIQAGSTPDSVPCGVPLFNVAALQASNSPENESSASDAASVPALEESRRDVPVRPDVIIPEAEPEMETTPHDEAGIPAIQGSQALPLPSSASETREIRLDPDWTYAKTIKLIRATIDKFGVEMDSVPDSLRPECWKPPGAPMPQGPLATANCDGAVQPVDQTLFDKAYALLAAALCSAIVDNCRPVIKRNSERGKPNPNKPLGRAAHHATHANFTRKPVSRLATAFRYLRPAYPLIVVPFDPKDAQKPAEPLPVSLTDYGKFQAQYGAVEEPGEPELDEAMLDASHEYHEFVACCFAELCDAIFSKLNNPKKQRAVRNGWKLGYFWLATRKESRVCEFKKYLGKLVPIPQTDRNGAETGSGQPCRN
ncbi:hypothetical protein HK105_204908 [Polyrhizophydium stewartii]|uniref:Uncharacterized protein n=1 Tax=Polyrhizophydium stewartii TaxID=2732419 RepID=A0ABR4N7J7_9FUNG